MENRKNRPVRQQKIRIQMIPIANNRPYNVIIVRVQCNTPQLHILQ